MGSVLATVPGALSEHPDAVHDLGAVAASGRTVQPSEAGYPLDRLGSRDANRGSPDVLLPLVANGVPVQLVVRVEAVHRSMDPVDDLVGVDAGDRYVGVPDPDA
jgi:hypothetical protein